MLTKVYVTRQGMISLEARIAELESKLREMQSHSAYIAEVGGNQYHDNSSYEMLVIDMRGVDHQLKEAHQIRNQAVIVDKPKDAASVRIGTTVEALINGSQKKLQIVGYGESDPESGRIAYNAPLAALLWRKEEGEEIEATISGRVVNITINRIYIEGE